jgi:aspartyl protease family protein
MNARHCIAAALCVAAAGIAHATNVNVIGLFPGKAVVVIDGGAPRTLSVGNRTPEGVLLVSADSKSATLEIDGKRETLEMGQHVENAAQTGSRSSVTLSTDASGHYITAGRVNGGEVRFMVDTGATMVTLPYADARRLGIDLSRARPATSMTANGPVQVYRVKLDTVQVGDLVMTNVDGIVHSGNALDIALLGMSFLNRTEMRREGANLMLIKRY